MAYTFKPYEKSEEVKKADEKAAEYNTYTRSDEVTGLFDKKNTYETNNNPGEWDANANGWQDIQNAYKDWSNRKAFSYDLNGDALYQQYKDKFINQGRLAMADTIGQASAMTGGYGSSYAVTAGNQAYQSSLQNLNDIVPQLYQMAYDRYTQEGNDLKDKYSMLNNMYSTKYGEHMDKQSLYNTTLDRLTTEAYNAQNFDYGKWDADRTYYTTVADNLYNRDFTAHNTNEQNNFSAYQQGVTEAYQNKQLEISQAQLKLQQDAANAPKVQGLSVEESIEVYDTLQGFKNLVYKDKDKKVKYTDNEKYAMIDEYIDTLAISDDEKAHLWQLYLPKSYLYPGGSGNTTFNTGVGIGKTNTMKN